MQTRSWSTGSGAWPRPAAGNCRRPCSTCSSRACTCTRATARCTWTMPRPTPCRPRSRRWSRCPTTRASPPSAGSGRRLPTDAAGPARRRPARAVRAAACRRGRSSTGRTDRPRRGASHGFPGAARGVIMAPCIEEPPMVRRIALALLLCGLAIAPGRAQSPADDDAARARAVLPWGLAIAPGRARSPADDDAARARAAVAGLMRIPGPDGGQETWRQRINGVDHWISIRGQDRANPVVLFVHGGPASPTIPSLWQFQRPLEEYFTMVHYDQRGAGKTWREDHSDALGETLRIQTYVDDLVAIAEHVRAKLGKQRLVLVAHSWGTIPAMHAALARPDLFHAYIGI